MANKILSRIGNLTQDALGRTSIIAASAILLLISCVPTSAQVSPAPECRVVNEDATLRTTDCTQSVAGERAQKKTAQDDDIVTFEFIGDPPYEQWVIRQQTGHPTSWLAQFREPALQPGFCIGCGSSGRPASGVLIYLSPPDKQWCDWWR